MVYELMTKIFLILSVFILSAVPSKADDPHLDELAVSFEGKYGQIEIGGKYAGVEFHRSRPLPSRISFYYPVANSIDLSTDYWRRYDSQPLSLDLSYNGITEAIGTEPFSYVYTPFFARFKSSKSVHRTEISYHFCEDLPVVVLEIKIQNISRVETEFLLTTNLQCALRTCQTYAVKNKARIYLQRKGADALVNFDDSETDSAQIFLLNAGDVTTRRSLGDNQYQDYVDPVIQHEYKKLLRPDEVLTVIQLIGSCRQNESSAVITKALQEWPRSVQTNEKRILDYAFNHSRFSVNDSAFVRTAHWAKAVLASNMHYLNGNIVPMPCPAEYNFFFTHDLLLTDLGGISFDSDRVKNDLLFLHSLTQADSILPHAYYWRDSGFQTEFCGTDNWNHLWLILLTSSYLKHTGDISTVKVLYPILQKSLGMMLQNKSAEEMMCAFRPDWWDIGHVYGARAYITILMIRALQEFCFVNFKLGYFGPESASYLQLSEKMQHQLVNKLWDEKAGYLINMLDTATVDNHYYSGSLLAAAFNILDPSRLRTLLKSARRELLDPDIGIRNAMPADFHNLIDVYKFRDSEAGGPYLYINGGVWPQGIVWYTLGWLAANEPDTAKRVLRKYLAIEGIENSPNGQPSFFEYRNADVQSLHYGEIDKPSFLWAGGMYLYALYRLAGLRENEWNLALSSSLPSDWENIEFDLLFLGARARVSIKGTGKFFSKILVDAEQSHSAVLTLPAHEIALQRGKPQYPYLAEARCVINGVRYHDRRLQVEVAGFPGQRIDLKIISPIALAEMHAGSRKINDGISISQGNGIWQIRADLRLKQQRENVIFSFK